MKIYNKVCPKASLFILGGKMWVLITGASSGIGMDAAKTFAKNGYNLILVARRKEKLEHLKKELENQVETICIPLDLSLPENIETLFKRIQELDVKIDVLINNAGAGAYGKFLELDTEKQLKLIDLNIRSLTHMAKLFGREMEKNGSGCIVNVASTAAFQSVPYMAVYSATKSYVLAFSVALSAELKKSGVKVVAFCPGATKTEFQATGNLKTSKFRGALLKSERVAELLYTASNGKKKVVVTGTFNKILTFFTGFLPRYFVAKLIKRSYEV